MSSTGELDGSRRRPFPVFVAVSRPRMRDELERVVGRDLLGGHLDVDDLVQGALEMLWPRYDVFDNEVTAHAYGVRAAITRASNARRYADRRSGLWLEALAREQVSEAPAADEAVLPLLGVCSVLRRLPGVKQRLAVALVDVADLRPEDAAAVLGTTPVRIKGLLQRARQRLREDWVEPAPGLALLMPRLRRPGLAAAVAAAPGLAMFALSLTVVQDPHTAAVRPGPARVAAPSPVAARIAAPPPARPAAASPARRVADPAPAARAGASAGGPRTSRSAPTAPLLPTPAGGACVGETCAGGRHGDRVCVRSVQEEFDPACANQGYVGVCPLVPDNPVATCERDRDPMLDPPPLP